MQWIYLDNNATTETTPEVIDAITEVNQTLWANPSSVHRLGQNVRHRVELARQQVAKLINSQPREIIFTSGGTEANNLAVRGFANPNAKNRIITTQTEHAAIREPSVMQATLANVQLSNIDIGQDGLIDLGQLQTTLEQNAAQGETILVTVQYASNETGVIQPLEKIAAIINSCKQQHPQARIYFHTDATQAVGKIPVNVRTLGVDMLSFAAHKFHGPKGAGALFMRTGVRLTAQQSGGPQERQQRSGTENTSGIIAMGVASEQAARFLSNPENRQQLARLRDQFENEILEKISGCTINPPLVNTHTADGQSYRLWNTTNIAFPRLHAEAILLALSENGVCASAGAACSSGSLDPSPVLLAMGVSEQAAIGSIRFSLSRFTTQQDIEQAVERVIAVITKLTKTLPRI